MENEQFDTVEDLINSDLFCSWVYQQQQAEFWQQWQINNPERQKLILEATTFLQQLSFQKQETGGDEVAIALKNIWDKIEDKPTITDENSSSTSVFPLKALGIAASVLFVIMAGWMTTFYFSDPYEIYATNYGETETLILPDNSEVVLQANSSLKVPKKWAVKAKREVWLEGEAFFSVTKSLPSNPVTFEVHTNDFTVEVLGTQFDVLNRTSNKRVVLQEGKVRLKWKETPSTDMLPNEMVIFSEKDQRYQKVEVNPVAYTAWTQQKLILNNTPLSEIARMLEENYGYQVHFSPKINQEQKRTSLGAIDIKNINNLIALIETSYDVKIIKQDQVINIRELN